MPDPPEGDLGDVTPAYADAATAEPAPCQIHPRGISTTAPEDTADAPADAAAAAPAAPDAPAGALGGVAIASRMLPPEGAACGASKDYAGSRPKPRDLTAAASTLADDDAPGRAAPADAPEGVAPADDDLHDDTVPADAPEGAAPADDDAPEGAVDRTHQAAPHASAAAWGRAAAPLLPCRCTAGSAKLGSAPNPPSRKTTGAFFPVTTPPFFALVRVRFG